MSALSSRPRALEVLSIATDHYGVHGLYSSVWRNGRTSKEALVVSLANFGGWIPGLGNLVGVCRIVMALMMRADLNKGIVPELSEEDRLRARDYDPEGVPDHKWMITAQIVRGVAEVLCLGILFAPFDIGLTLGRECKDFRAAQSHQHRRFPRPVILEALSRL